MHRMRLSATLHVRWAYCSRNSANSSDRPPGLKLRLTSCSGVAAAGSASVPVSPKPERRHPREDAAGLRASHSISPRFVHSCCLLRMSWRATRYHGGCRHLCRDLGQAYQVNYASYAAGCYAVDTHWVRCCLQDWKAVVPPQPTAHHTAQHLRAPQSPVPRFGERSQEEQLAHRQPPPRGAYLCVTACLDCSVCRYAHVSVHVGNMYCKSRQSLHKLSSYLAHAAGAMPEPNAEQPPPPLRGNVEKDAIGPGSEPMEFARYWKDAQARQRRRTEEPASSSGRAPEPSWSWESWSRWDWQDDSWRGSRWK